MDSIWLTLLFPLLGSLMCATHFKTLGKSTTGALASLAILAAFLVSAERWYFVQEHPAYTSVLAHWLVLPGVAGLDVAAFVDHLSTTMLMTVTGVGFLIHCYSMGYMADEEDYGRFFACMNLFVATMVCLVLANNLAFLLVGWGGVGFASYSLIGFYRHKPSAVSAARKAFLINVVGDVGMMLGAFLCAARLGTVELQKILTPESLQGLGSDVLLLASLLIIAAYAKSAQLPLHTWLPDAMEGPTPVSALIHAATMVTAGVYLLVRCAPLYLALPQDLRALLAIFGALTALAAALCAIVQNDLKRILAYSTMSQLGYMFMAAGVGATGAAIFHLVSHAFFKALLFLTAGVVIHALHGEQDITRMGGLARHLKGSRWAFLIGSLALAGVPPLAGYWSKEAILVSTFHSTINEHTVLWAVGILTALLTAYYTGRAYFLVFHGPERFEGTLHHPGSSMTWPLAVLSLATVTAGAMGEGLMLDLNVVPSAPHELFGGPQAVAVAVGLVGLGVAYSKHKDGLASIVPDGAVVFLRACEAVDGLYKQLASRFRHLADLFAAKIDPVASRQAPDLIARSMLGTSNVLCQLQGGSLRLYAVAILASTSLLALFVFGMVALAGGTGGAP